MNIKKGWKLIIEVGCTLRLRKKLLQTMVRDNFCSIHNQRLGMFTLFCIVGYNLFQWLMDKEEEVGVSYERLKLRRMQAN